MTSLRELDLACKSKKIIPTSTKHIAHFFPCFSWFSDNQLDGTLPEELYELSELEFLSLSGNLLQGSISPSVTKLKSITQLGKNQKIMTTHTIVIWHANTNTNQ
jgi:Leucine-rich repeat (LRR) protein